MLYSPSSLVFCDCSSLVARFLRVTLAAGMPPPGIRDKATHCGAKFLGDEAEA